MVKLVDSRSVSGAVYPEADFIAVEARGKARIHLSNYASGFSGHALKYAVIKRIFSDLDEWGILDRLDQLCFLALDEQGSLVNWVSAGSQPLNVGMAFAAGQGFQGDGVASYIDTGFNPSAPGSQYRANGGHFGVYLVDVGSEGTGNIAFGHSGGVSRALLYPRMANGRSGFRINMTSTATVTHDRHGEPGFYLVNRAGANTVRFLVDGDLKFSDTNTAASESPNETFRIGNFLSGYGDGIYAGWSIGRNMLVGLDQEQKLSEAFSRLADAFLT